MNRIIITGNGFDLAHGLKTSYRDFIDDYWGNVLVSIWSPYFQKIDKDFGTLHTPEPYNDEFVHIYTRSGKSKINNPHFNTQGNSQYSELCRYIKMASKQEDNIAPYFEIKNDFLGLISNRCALINWVDIENEYYSELKSLLEGLTVDERSAKIKKLNTEFDAVKILLEQYLTKVAAQSELEAYQSISKEFLMPVDIADIAVCQQKAFVDSIMNEVYRYNDENDFKEDKRTDPKYGLCNTKDEENSHYVLKSMKNGSFKKNYCTPNNTIILNFNYTKTAENTYFHNEDRYQVINIHGELNNANNPIIFGYGDELDVHYKEIEKLQDNDFLENIKSIKYHTTGNYRELLMALESELYQVYIMGHSCGNSDRTLLNTIFEHKNCMSLKVFYWQRDGDTDDYSNLIKNISRNFNDKRTMRDIVVSKERCSPLISAPKNDMVDEKLVTNLEG